MPQALTKKKSDSKNLVFRQSNKISRAPTVPGLRQAKAYRFFLLKAKENLLTQDYHRVYQEELRDFLGTNDWNDLRASIQELRRIEINWELLPQKGSGDDELLWGSSPLLADCALKRDKKGTIYFEYSFSPKMRKELSNPKFYREMDLSIIKEFQSSYSLKFYEFCHAALNPGQDYVLTEYISKENFWALLGLGPDEYKNSYNFKKRVLTPGISEVNALTDLNIEIERVKRKPRQYDFRFKIRRQNVQTQLKLNDKKLTKAVEKYESASASTQKDLHSDFLQEQPNLRNKKDSAAYNNAFYSWIYDRYCEKTDLPQEQESLKMATNIMEAG